MFDVLSKIWDVLKEIGGPLVNKIRERRSRKRVVERLQSLKKIQKQLLKSSLSAAKDSEGRIFLWTRTGGAMCMFYTQLIFLIDEGAVLVLEDPEPNTKAYRFKPWLYDYLVQHPDLLGVEE